MSEEKKHICFPVKQYRWNGIRHIGIKGCYIGKCKCGKYLKFESTPIWNGWFETSDEILINYFNSKESNHDK